MHKIKKLIKKIIKINSNKKMYQTYFERYQKYSFKAGKCEYEQQFEASITRLYHTIEKGLSYLNFRVGFGKNNVNALISAMEEYSEKYSVDSFCYKTALSVLEQYIEKNKSYGVVDQELEARVDSLTGSSNAEGGVLSFEPLTAAQMHKADYQAFAIGRHSIRHFSDQAVEIDKVRRGVELAQFTPSACNRQGWRTRIISDKALLNEVLKNQNGNKGFGDEINKLLLVTADLKCFNCEREIFQAYIDGGMYAMSLINSLHYECLGTIPLSASLNEEQENNVRKLMKIEESEVFIIYIGVGNYPDVCQTTKSTRHLADIIIL